MDGAETEAVLRNLDQRVGRIEQILPTLPTRDEMRSAIQDAVAPLATKEELRAAIAPLATKEELRAAIAPLATKEELRAAIAPLATKDELREEGERTRRHFDVVAEGLAVQIKVIAEGHAALKTSIDDLRTELKADVAGLDKRVTALEAERSQRRRR
jgi:alkylhydroperoxidase/carboxymuconolactone decarboxylase family protein YurZ